MGKIKTLMMGQISMPIDKQSPLGQLGLRGLCFPGNSRKFLAAASIHLISQLDKITILLSIRFFWIPRKIPRKNSSHLICRCISTYFLMTIIACLGLYLSIFFQLKSIHATNLNDASIPSRGRNDRSCPFPPIPFSPNVSLVSHHRPTGCQTLNIIVQRL